MTTYEVRRRARWVAEPPPRSQLARPQLVIIGGPNGAGKSTSAASLLRDTLDLAAFVNADDIARGLSAFDPQRAAIAAGRILLGRLEELRGERADAAFESTLAGPGALRIMRRFLARAYDVHVIYLWLANADIAVERVRVRSASGGHFVPEADVRRRFARGLLAFLDEARLLTTSWQMYDANLPAEPRLIAGGAHSVTTVYDEGAWTYVLAHANAVRGGSPI